MFCTVCNKWAGAVVLLPGQPREHLCVCVTTTKTQKIHYSLVELLETIAFDPKVKVPPQLQAKAMTLLEEIKS